MKSSRLLIVAVLMVGSVPKVHAWDDFGHMQVAAVAYDQLTAATKTRVGQLLKLNPSYANWIVGAKPNEADRAAFVRASTWADAIKDTRRSQYTFDKPDSPTAKQNVGFADKIVHDYWHYIDVPFSADGSATVPAQEPNAQTQIAAFRAVLSKKGPSDDVKSYDLVWLLHLVGDVHQPLHCITRFDAHLAPPEGDRGGNNIKIAGNRPIPLCNDSRYCPYGLATDLHIFVDTITGDSYSLADVYNATKQLPRPSKKDIVVDDEASWIQESFELAKSEIYKAPISLGPGPFTIDEAYQRALLTFAKKRISLAGQRLGRMLNELFAQEAKDGSRADALHTIRYGRMPAAVDSLEQLVRRDVHRMMQRLQQDVLATRRRAGPVPVVLL